MAKTLKQQLAEVNEYEREPVPPSSLKSSTSFLGMYAGEHTAGPRHALMDGALETGLRVAAEILGDTR